MHLHHVPLTTLSHLLAAASRHLSGVAPADSGTHVVVPVPHDASIRV